MSAPPPAPLAASALSFVPVKVVDGTFISTQSTALLLEQVGGGDAIRRMTRIFYESFHLDTHIAKFVADTSEPHGDRLGNWIVEKMGGGDVWSAERVERAKCPVEKVVGFGATAHAHIVHDRSSAHHAAWFCPRRPVHEMGQRFKLLDARVWMRLMFLACRTSGLFDHAAFADWFVFFIAHFIRVYEATAPPYAARDAEWSAEPSNVDAYVAGGRAMKFIPAAPWEADRRL